MPIYIHECVQCKKRLEFFRPVSQYKKSEQCQDCGKEAKRVFSFHKEKEFVTFYDEQYGCEISSRRQEEKLMRKHGHIDARDTPQIERFKDEIKRKQKKRIYSYAQR